jgi:hypothetical protein
MLGLRASPMAFAGLFCLAAASGLVIAPADASAKPSLKQAVMALDGKYLKDYPPDAIDHSVKIVAGGDTQKLVPEEIGYGSVTAKLTYGAGKVADPEGGPMPIVTVFEDGKQVAQLKNDGTGSEYPFVVQLAEIDPGNDTPELVFSYYTGGAHCCGETQVATKTADGWKVVEVGSFDGGTVSAADLDGDGRYEFQVTDDAFDYAFGCYACTIKPMKILTVENGKVKNVSAEKRFHAVQAGWMKTIVGAAQNDDPNAYLAGYVAQKILLGEGEEAWKLMLAYYDPKNDWGLKICPEPFDDKGECPVKEVTYTYPQALAYVLKQNGYTVPK